MESLNNLSSNSDSEIESLRLQGQEVVMEVCKEHTGFRKKIAKLRRRYKNIRKENTELKRGYESIREENAELRGLYENIREENTELKRGYESIREEIAELSKTLENHQPKVELADNVITRNAPEPEEVKTHGSWYHGGAKHLLQAGLGFAIVAIVVPAACWAISKLFG